MQIFSFCLHVVLADVIRDFPRVLCIVLRSGRRKEEGEEADDLKAGTAGPQDIR